MQNPPTPTMPRRGRGRPPRDLPTTGGEHRVNLILTQEIANEVTRFARLEERSTTAMLRRLVVAGIAAYNARSDSCPV